MRGGTVVVQQQTILNVADNTGAKKIMVIRVLGGSRKRFGRLGDIVVASVKEAIPNGNVKKGDVVFLSYYLLINSLLYNSIMPFILNLNLKQFLLRCT